MYTFHALADIPVSHEGLFIVGMGCTMWLAIVLFNCAEEFFVNFFLVFIVMSISYGVSYHWTNQEPKTFKNERVTATFVGYESEGYKERSGKSYVDRHFTYVVYKVEGGNVMLPCTVGTAYPETAVLYKN